METPPLAIRSMRWEYADVIWLVTFHNRTLIFDGCGVRVRIKELTLQRDICLKETRDHVFKCYQLFRTQGVVYIMDHLSCPVSKGIFIWSRLHGLSSEKKCNVKAFGPLTRCKV